MLVFRGVMISLPTHPSLSASILCVYPSKARGKKQFVAEILYLRLPILRQVKSLEENCTSWCISVVYYINIALFTGFYTSQVVQDFFHQEYENQIANGNIQLFELRSKRPEQRYTNEIFSPLPAFHPFCSPATPPPPPQSKETILYESTSSTSTTTWVKNPTPSIWTLVEN